MKHVQITVDSQIVFDHQAEIQFNPVLNPQDSPSFGQPPCEMQVFIRYGQRREDVTVVVS